MYTVGQHVKRAGGNKTRDGEVERERERWSAEWIVVSSQANLPFRLSNRIFAYIAGGPPLVEGEVWAGGSGGAGPCIDSSNFLDLSTRHYPFLQLCVCANSRRVRRGTLETS